MNVTERQPLRCETAIRLDPVAAAQVLGFSARFAFGNFFKCLKVTIVPLVVGGAILFGLLSTYLSQLAEYLNHPAGEIASRVLGVAAAIPIVMTLVDSLITASLAELVMGRKILGPAFLGIRQWEWRLCAANLALLLLVSVVITILLAWSFFIAVLRWSGEFQQILRYLLGIPLLLLFVRAWFFVLPTCIHANEGEVLIRSWRKSAGRLLPLVATLLPIGAVLFMVQALTDRLLRSLQILSIPDVGATAGANIAFLQTNLLSFVVSLGVTYFFGIVLLTPARLQAYDRFSAHDECRK